MKHLILMSATAAMALSGCMGTSQTSSHAAAMSGMAVVQRAADSQPTQTDLAKSCAQIEAELSRLYARSAELERAARAEERKTSLARGAVNTGLAALTMSGLTGAGSVSEIRNVQTASTVAGTVANSTMGSSGPDARTTNETMAVFERTSLLERTKLQKGC